MDPPSRESTNSSSELDELVLAPPPINYSLHARKKAIIITWLIIIADSCILPIFMFYVLWFSRLSHSNTFNILSSMFGIPTLLQWGKRLWYLCKKDSDCRPIGGEKLRLDFFQIGFTVMIIVITVEIVLAVVPLNPIVPLFNMIQETLLFIIGFYLIMSFLLFNMGVTQPIRISSAPKGGFYRPLVYTLVEDIVAVDGGGGRKFREELNARYEASPLFRRMLNRLDAFWGLGAITIAGAVTAMLWTIPVAESYWIAWVVPFAWAAVWAKLTIQYVRNCLAKEHSEWKLSCLPASQTDMAMSSLSSPVILPPPAYLPGVGHVV